MKRFLGSMLLISLFYQLMKNRGYIYDMLDLRTLKHLYTLEDATRKKAEKLLEMASEQGIKLKIISGYRTCEEQDLLYAQGRTMPGRIVTYARCGESDHNKGIAFDVVEFEKGVPLWKNEKWELIGKMGESVGLNWGGRWKRHTDYPHFYNEKKI